MSQKPVRTAKDTTLVVLTFVAVLLSAVLRLTGRLDGVATALLLVAIFTSTWVAWRWYDREPDGRRGE